jgi:hypothetical protein
MRIGNTPSFEQDRICIATIIQEALNLLYDEQNTDHQRVTTPSSDMMRPSGKTQDMPPTQQWEAVAKQKANRVQDHNVEDWIICQGAW